MKCGCRRFLLVLQVVTMEELVPLLESASVKLTSMDTTVLSSKSPIASSTVSFSFILVSPPDCGLLEERSTWRYFQGAVTGNWTDNAFDGNHSQSKQQDKEEKKKKKK